MQIEEYRNNHTVSVIMPLYNASLYVKAAIESVKVQTYPDWELIIVDDGSSDGSYDIAKTFESDRIKVFTQKNSGACVARNLALEKSTGEFVKFLDADDILDKDCLYQQVNQIATLRDNQIPFGDYDYIDKDGGIIRSYFWSPDCLNELRKNQPYFFFKNWQVLITAPLHRRRHLKEIGGFDPSFKRGQEADMHFRLALSGIEFVYCPCHTFSYREYQSSSKITSKYEKGLIDKKAYWRHKNDRCEMLLVERFGYVPDEYLSHFSRFWFDESRDAFASGDKESGHEFLSRSRSFKADTLFQRLYYCGGRVFGFRFMERIFRLRLKLLGKDR